MHYHIKFTDEHGRAENIAPIRTRDLAESLRAALLSFYRVVYSAEIDSSISECRDILCVADAIVGNHHAEEES